LVSLAQVQEIPPKKTFLLVGPPGVGKTAFCEEAALRNLALDRPVIYLTTKSDPAEVEEDLRERGLGDAQTGPLSFIDAYNDTVGLPVSDRPGTATANCEDLSSMGIAISKLQERIGTENILLVFDSLTSPYLFSKPEILRFLRSTLSSFAARGNGVLASFDEGSGGEEDLVAMMSLCSSVLRIEKTEGGRVLNIIKHPRLGPATIEIPTDEVWQGRILDTQAWDEANVERLMKGIVSGDGLPASGVNLFWPNLARWSAVLWDPKRVPKMTYDFSVEFSSYSREMISMLPWHTRLLFRSFVPKDFSRTRDMKKLFGKFLDPRHFRSRAYGIAEYLEDLSSKDEHYFRIHESFECSGLENTGITCALSAFYVPGMCMGLEKEERTWSAVETKCLGLGDPYCEFELVPGEVHGLGESLVKDSDALARIHDRLMDRIMGFMLHNRPLVERPTLGPDFLMGGEMSSLPMARGRSRIAIRMGAARSGKEVGERLLQAGLDEDQAESRLLDFLRHCNVGTVTRGETIRIEDNRENLWTRFYTTKWQDPCCFFTTGFLNGFFSAVKDQRVKETRCIAMGDPYCEWEFR
jgi:predicted hydrocarbon binding protein/KaiC/GvpD/RAD55 family RecA-like ATPase